MSTTSGFGLPVGDRYRALHDGADEAAAAVMAELRSRHDGAEERAALAHALVRAAKAEAEEALAALLDEHLLAIPTYVFWRLSTLTGLSEATIRRRHEALVRSGLAQGWLQARDDGRVYRAERRPA